MMTTSLSYPDFVGLSDANKLDQAFARIVQALKTGEAQFLFGAGMSKESNVPIGENLSLMFLNDFFPGTKGNRKSKPGKTRKKELINEFPFEAIVKAIENLPGKGREDLTVRLKDIFLETDYELSDEHRDFLSVGYFGGTSLLTCVFTTNLDPLLYNAIGEDRATLITENNVGDIKDVLLSGKIPIICLHGSLEEDDYKITETDLFDQKYFGLESEFYTALTSSDAFVFIGYSMNDPDLRYIYMTYHKAILERGKKRRTTYVVLPAKDKFSYILGKEIWEARGALWIPLEAKTFFAKLKQKMETELDEEVKKTVMKKYNIQGDEDTLKQLIKSTAEPWRLSRDDALIFLHQVRTRSGGKI